MPNCHKCNKSLVVWMDWFGEECPEDPGNGHHLSEPEIRTLTGWDISQSALVRVTPEGCLHTMREGT